MSVPGSLSPTRPLATTASCLAAPSDIRYVYWTRPWRGKLLDLHRDGNDATGGISQSWMSKSSLVEQGWKVMSLLLTGSGNLWDGGPPSTLDVKGGEEAGCVRGSSSVKAPRFARGSWCQRARLLSYDTTSSHSPLTRTEWATRATSVPWWFVCRMRSNCPIAMALAANLFRHSNRILHIQLSWLIDCNVRTDKLDPFTQSQLRPGDIFHI